MIRRTCWGRIAGVETPGRVARPCGTAVRLARVCGLAEGEQRMHCSRHPVAAKIK